MEDKFYLRTKKIIELINAFEYPEYLLVFWKYDFDDQTEEYSFWIDVEKHDQEPFTISFRLTYDQIACLDNFYENLYNQIKQRIID